MKNVGLGHIQTNWCRGDRLAYKCAADRHSAASEKHVTRCHGNGVCLFILFETMFFLWKYLTERWLCFGFWPAYRQASGFQTASKNGQNALHVFCVCLRKQGDLFIKQAKILNISALPTSDVQKCEKLAAQKQMARTYWVNDRKSQLWQGQFHSAIGGRHVGRPRNRWTAYVLKGRKWWTKEKREERKVEEYKYDALMASDCAECYLLGRDPV